MLELEKWNIFRKATEQKDIYLCINGFAIDGAKDHRELTAASWFIDRREELHRTRAVSMLHMSLHQREHISLVL